ncbi:RelA/SpoT domain-containing protein [Burkholderia gladioli]|uniref:RelA/SpoT domain-containing protein n=1 Tax=Burkholderia gladioli TaxID=28095 RepID=UPI0015E3EC28|nr:RelA/SpoT domain-containing protein [Burkholderia gladioli]
MNEKTEKHKILTEVDESQFLTRNRISREEWSNSGCSWGELQGIAADHENNLSKLSTVADFIAKTIQNFSGVHSVRWRVKDTEHLIEKIIRKKADSDFCDKYEGINESNYNEIITDLIGVRALHLFKDDCIDIHRQLLSTWKPIEPPISYTRKGDSEDFVKKLTKSGLLAIEHKAGYRSLHYVVESKPTNRPMRAEIQVRTLFEEGWSEIDHTVRYPNFMNDPITNYLLTIFNRMAGSADEMGGFVRQLAETLRRSGDELRAAVEDRDRAIVQIQATMVDLENSRDSEESYRMLAKKLNAELIRLKDAQNKEMNASNLISEDNLTAAQLSGLFGLAGFKTPQEAFYAHRAKAFEKNILTAGKTLKSLKDSIRKDDSKPPGDDQEES